MKLKARVLKGSCHCGKVRFQVRSRNYVPYQRCYCSICRKTQGGGGYAINLSAEAETLTVTGKRYLKKFRARVRNPGERAYLSPGERHFCGHCGSALWLYDRRWPELVHPFASAIDTPLPKAPEQTHLLLEFKAPWVVLHADKKDRKFRRYPKESIAEWHERVFPAHK